MTETLGSAADLALSLRARFESSRLRNIGTSSNANEEFAEELEKSFCQRIRRQFLDCASAIINRLNGLGHDLVLDAVESDAMCVRYSRTSSHSEPDDLVVCFDLGTEVFLSDKTSQSRKEWPFKKEDGCNITDYSVFARSTLDRLSYDLPLLKQQCEALQTALENDICERIRPSVVLFADALIILGHNLDDLGSASPMIDYRDPESGLHFGITCIATVISRHLPSDFS